MTATLIRERTERLGPLERLEALCDPGSVQVLRSRIVSSRLGARAVEGDGVVGAIGMVAGRPIACYAQDGAFLGGSLGERHADTIVRVLQTAERARIPVVGFVESGGARMQEGTAALGGYGRIFRHTVGLTGVVPQISVCQRLLGGRRRLLAGAHRPDPDDRGRGDVPDRPRRGPRGARRGDRRRRPRRPARARPQRRLPPGRARRDRGRGQVRELLGFLPSASGETPPRDGPDAARDRRPRSVVPAEPRRVYDVRDALAGIVDAGSLLELQPRWARNVVTALARIDGRPVAIVANQPRHLGGVLDAVGSEKAARFVNFCDSFGLPLIAVVDTPGFMPGSKQEQAGVIRHGASLVRAFAAARVPKLTVSCASPTAAPTSR